MQRWSLAALIVVLGLGLGLRLGYAADGDDHQPPDSRAYARIAENLYRDGTFDAREPGVRREVQPSSAYSPGLPFVVAAIYWLTGGVHLTLARLVLALVGAGSVLLTYLLGRRLAGPGAGLGAAAVLAIYPALLDYQGLLLTEPLASFLLAASLLAFLRADDRPGTWAWVGTGALLGTLSLVRPEYLAIAALLPLLALLRAAKRGDARQGLLAAAITALATIVLLAPWTIRNIVVLDRAVPISTGGGKALYIGTYLDADGDGPKLREILYRRESPQVRRRLARGGPIEDPNRFVLERLLARVAAREYPGVDTDVALGRLGRQNLGDDITEHPGRFASMLAAKAYDTWTDAARSVMLEQPWRTLQLGLLLAALAGLAVLAMRRRFEALVLALILLYVTAIGALLIATPRRELVVLPLLAALAGAAGAYAVNGLAALRGRGRQVSA